MAISMPAYEYAGELDDLPSMVAAVKRITAHAAPPATRFTPNPLADEFDLAWDEHDLAVVS